MTIAELFMEKRSKLSIYVDEAHFKTIRESFYEDLQKRNERLTKDTEKNMRQMFVFLLKYLHTNIDEAKKLTTLAEDMKKELSLVVDPKQKEELILDYAFRFDPSKSRLHQDKLAFSRWFDEEALTERIVTKVSRIHRLTISILDRLSVTYSILLNIYRDDTEIWTKFYLNQHFSYLLEYRKETQLTHSVLRAFLHMLRGFSKAQLVNTVDKKLIAFFYKILNSKTEDVWTQNDVLEFIYQVSIDDFLNLAKQYYEGVVSDEKIFVRHKIAKLCMEISKTDERAVAFINQMIISDESPYVRQALAKKMLGITHDDLLYIREQLILRDPDKTVRALAVTQVLDESLLDEQKKVLYELIGRSIESEKDPFVLKVVLHSIRQLALLSKEKTDIDTYFMHDSFQQIEALINTDTDIAVKRYAAMVREVIWLSFDDERLMIYKRLQRFIQTIKVGHIKLLPKEFYEVHEGELFRILSIVAQDDFSLEVRHTLTHRMLIQRSEKFKRRGWRIWYEFMHPSSDKRQAFLHTIARVYEGTYHFPSAIMAEQAPTKVPGEPYYIPEEESARPFLPLPDHFLSSLRQSTLKIYPYILYTSDGITTIEPPKGIWRRFKASWKFTLGFENIARLRNWRTNSSEAPSSYINAMRDLGFEVAYQPYVKEDKSTTKFFSVALPLPFLPLDTQESIGRYFLSAYENTLGDLMIFMIVIFSMFFIRHVILSFKIKRARKRIPLSIGGWGTRRKSGTERLKASLFNGLGYRVFSKTTGNEAMFLHSESFEPMLEMYLFRPYDKATIWEQANTVLMADRLDVDIYLWESMGLTPEYVNILQQRWMLDDIATITNTYPDHEDLQGPAGINIPQVMTNFIPPNSILVSTEEIMSPILKEHARHVDTSYHQKGWLKAGLIAPDILSRFPYEEHPSNIALVLGVAEELEIDEDEALKIMADHIVPDLGVLKDYPPAHIGSKTLSFINGMSANERFGALGNWKRMGLENISDESEPEMMITAVINNRADRVARSRVFASMVIEDIVADKYLLIGSNLSGFQSYLEESWENYKSKLSLAVSEDESSTDKLLQYAKKYRLIRNTQQLRDNLEIMLKSSGLTSVLKDEVLENFDNLDILEQLLHTEQESLVFYKELIEQYNDYKNIVSKISQKENVEKLNVHLREYIWKWIDKKIHVVEDYYANGKEVIEEIYHITLPGKHNRIIGMQNIKGTGLDFAYQWVEWEKCFKFCHTILSSDSKKIHQAIDSLAAFDHHNILTEELVQQTLQFSKDAMVTQNEYLQAQIQYIEKRLENKETSHSKKDKKIKMTRFSWLKQRSIEVLEAFLDAGDAVKRRKKANKIYKDLANHHISHKKASAELKKITTRQKGGWLFNAKLK